MEPNSMNMEFNMKTKDYPANCNSSITSKPQQSSQYACINLQSSVQIQPEVQVKKETLDGDAFDESTISTGGALAGSNQIKEEDTFVISSYRSLPNDPAEENKWNVQSPMITETNIKTEVIDDPATCSSTTQVTKEKLDGDAYTQETISTDGALARSHTIKEEDTFVISSCSLANNPAAENKGNLQIPTLRGTEDKKDEHYSNFIDKKSDTATSNSNCASTFTDDKDNRDETDTMLIVKAETGEVCEVIEMSKDSTSQPGNKKLKTEKRTKQKQFKCNECHFSCSDKSVLKRHKRIHSGEKPFKCNECDYSCSRTDVLRIHKQIHTGEKPFKCDKCSYSSYQKGHLKLHTLREHSTEKPFKCDECDYACSQKGALKVHKLSKHTKDKPFKCDKCSYVCCQSSDIKRHELKHTGEKLFKCDTCNKLFSRKQYLKQHIERFHSV